MRIPTLARRSLTLVLTAALATPSLAMAATVTGAPLAIVAFGEANAVSSDRQAIASSSAPTLSPADVGLLDRDTADHILATVNASALPLALDESLVLSQLMESGAPVLLHMDVTDTDDVNRVSALFGIAPSEGDVVLRKERNTMSVFAPAAQSPGDTSQLLEALALSAPSSLALSSEEPHLTAAADSPVRLPSRHFNINLIDSEGEISGTAGIDVTRSRTNAADNKLITIVSKTSARPKVDPIFERTLTNDRLYITKLPVEYWVGHVVVAGDPVVTYLDSFPQTDGRTDFTQTDTESRGFSIGGSVGSELSRSGKPDEMLAAKVPFNLSFGYEHKWQSSLSNTFRDYSLQAIPDGFSSVYWRAPIAPSLKKVLVKSSSTLYMSLTEEKMTPMMRMASLSAMSHWKVHGAYDGLAVVSVSAGYTVERNEWSSKRPTQPLVHKSEPVGRYVGNHFYVDMSDPHLSSEITVLIRSATGSGACLRDNASVVELAPCLATDRNQMWGLDASSRYVNRGSGQCLSVQPATRTVTTVGCENITYEKQWQWRADRLHSMIDHGQYRLYVEGGVVHYAAAQGRFAEYPVNPYGAPLEPWTNYPAKPRPGIDQIPAPHGSRIEFVPAGYDQFPAVSNDQRWNLQVLRTGL